MVYRVAGYVKLAKLWERRRDAAIKLHNDYFRQKYENTSDFELAHVYVDITGQKTITKRQEMIRLLKLCIYAEVDIIDVPTKAYLAANMEKFCFLLHFLFSLNHRVDIVTEDADYHIDTLTNRKNVRETLKEMAAEYVSLSNERYDKWHTQLIAAIEKVSPQRML